MVFKRARNRYYMSICICICLEISFLGVGLRWWLVCMWVGLGDL